MKLTGLFQWIDRWGWGALERAFSLAKSGACTTVGEIRIALKAEGYTIEQIIGPA